MHRLATSIGSSAATVAAAVARSAGARGSLSAASRRLPAATTMPLLSTHSQRRSLFVQFFQTPNEYSLKFHPTGLDVLPEGMQPMDFRSPLDAYASPLAKAIFKVDGVRGVFLQHDFVTVTIDEDSKWSEVKPYVTEAITNHYMSGRPVVDPNAARDQAGGSHVIEEDDDEVIIAIKEVLETKVRPVVQEDGGDVQFVKFERGVCYVQLQGACTTCSSSLATLKNGIENLLTHYIPEVESVEQFKDEAFVKTEQEIEARRAAEEEAGDAGGDSAAAATTTKPE